MILYDPTLTPQQVEDTLEVLKRVKVGLRPSSPLHGAIDSIRSMLVDIHHAMSRRARTRAVGERIAD